LPIRPVEEADILSKNAPQLGGVASPGKMGKELKYDSLLTDKFRVQDKKNQLE
jgi:hypothetical protein